MTGLLTSKLSFIISAHTCKLLTACMFSSSNCLFFYSTVFVTNIFIFSSPANITSNTGETQIQFISLIFAGVLIITVVSLFGNSVVIHIIRTNNSMKTTTNYLILNQACADLLITLLGLLDIIEFRYISQDGLWFGGLLGLITCHVSEASMFILHFFSVWILATIAVDRFYAVSRPLESSPLSRHLKKTIMLLWVWCSVSSISFLISINFEKLDGSYYCDFNSFYLGDPKTIDIISLTLNVLAPLVLIVVLYTIVCIKLWSREVPGEGTSQNEGQAEAVKVAKKVTWMMIVVVVLYTVCWIPLSFLLIIQSFGYIQKSWSLLYPFFWFTLAFSGLNPYIYFGFSQKFRNCLKDLFGNCLRKLNIHSFLPFRSQSVELERI